MNPSRRQGMTRRRPSIRRSGQNRKAQTKVRLIWTNCGVTSTANWAAFLVATKVAPTVRKAVWVVVLAAAMTAAPVASSPT